LSDEEKVKELIERIQRLAKKQQDVEARMKKVEKVLQSRKRQK
jgi:Tfp pilus assembly protein PilN